MPRLFVAIDLPDSIKDRITELCSFGLPGVSWVKYEQYHLSLRFVGEVDENSRERIGTALSKVRGASFELVLKGVGVFPQKKTPRVVWTGVEKNESLIQLRNKVEHQLNQIGIQKESRKFHPHLTLGRVKSKKVARIGDYLSHYALFKSEPFPVEEFVLFSSRLTPKGAIYTKEIIYQLRVG